MGSVKDSLIKIIVQMNKIPKAQAVFVTNVAGNDVDWEMSFQFNLDKERPFYLIIKNKKAAITDGTKSDAEIVISGDPNALVKICNGQGDFTHAISREEIIIEQGKVMDVIRLTRAISIVLQAKK